MTLMQLPNLLPPAFVLEDLVRELSHTDIPWSREYNEYQSGGWWTCSLLGRSAEATDVEVTDAPQPVATNALDKLPIMQKLLREMPLQYMMARLARLDPHSTLWEHRDYQNLRQVPRQRIHLPLQTNTNAFLVSGSRKFHMGLGKLWTFRPTIAHGSCNLGDTQRLHLIIDAYEDEFLTEQSNEATVSPSVPMARISPEDLNEKIRTLHRTLRTSDANTPENASPNSLAAWEQAVLKLYFAFAVPEGDLYHALEEVCRQEGDDARASFWTARRRLVLEDGVHA